MSNTYTIAHRSDKYDTVKNENKFKGILSLFIMFFAFTAVCELTYRISIDTAFWGAGIFYILIFSVPSALFLSLMTCCFNKKTAMGIHIAVSSLIFIFYSSQICYYKIFGTYYTVFSAVNGGDAFQFKSAIYLSIDDSALYIIFILAAAVLSVIITVKKIGYTRLTLKEAAMTFAAVLLTFIAAFGSLLVGGKSVLSPYDTYMNSSSSAEMRTSQLGLMTTFRVDMERFLFGFPDINSMDIEESGLFYTLTESEAEPNAMDIDFNALAESETNEEFKDLNLYFASKSPTYQNEYTGIYEGYNLIYITAEAFAPYAIDPELTPTLYKLYSEGYDFSNFYNPLWGVSTSDGEYVNCQSLIPKSGVWSMSKSYDNYLPFTLGNQFRNIGYNTYAYHNHYYTYYDRDLSHPNMGYDYKGLGNGLDVTEMWPESDLEMMEKSVDEFINDENFHVYYLTVSGHLLYNWGGNNMCKKHKDEVAGLPYSEACKAYMACNIEFDRAMEYLLKRLEEAGIADKTVIAIAADHYPYGLENSEISEFLGHEVDPEFELYKSCFILYAPGTEKVEVEKYCSTLDIIPTLSNLFGLEYDSRLLMGADIFSDTEPMVVFNSKNWITDKGRFIASSGTFEAFEGFEESPEQSYSDYIDSTNARVSNMFKVSEKILDNDYYRYLFQNQ